MSGPDDPVGRSLSHIDEFLRRYHAAGDAANAAQYAREQLTWQVAAWSLVQQSTSSQASEQVKEQLTHQYESLLFRLPLMPQYAPTVKADVSITMTSGSTMLYSEVITGRDRSELPSDLAAPVIGQYELLQNKQSRFDDAAAELEAVFPALARLFDECQRAVTLGKTRPEDLPKAAIEVRTLLDKLWGELLQRARRVPKEHLTWPEVAARLVRADGRRRSFLDQEGAWRDLTSRLSSMAKRRAPLTVTDMSEAWAAAVDHVFIVCACVRETPPQGDVGQV